MCFPCFGVSHYLWFTIMAPLLFVWSTKLHNSKKIKRAPCNYLHSGTAKRLCTVPGEPWHLVLALPSVFPLPPVKLQHSTLLSRKPRHNEGTELMLPHPSERSILGQRLCHCCHPHFLLLLYLVTNEKDKCRKWRISNVTWAHPARKNLKERAHEKDILVHWVQSCLENTLSSPLQRFTKFPFEESPITPLLTRDLLQSFIPLVIRNLPGISLGIFPQKFLYPVNSIVFPPA